MIKITISTNIQEGMEISMKGNKYTVIEINHKTNELLTDQYLKNYRLQNNQTKQIADYYLATLIDNSAEITS